NLTKGNGGLPADYDASDWLRSLKHGLRRNGKPLIFMPSQEYTHLSEKDMAAIIAYCSSVDPVDRELPETNIGPLARVLSDIGKHAVRPEEVIDHPRQLLTGVNTEVSGENGKEQAVASQG